MLQLGKLKITIKAINIQIVRETILPAVEKLNRSRRTSTRNARMRKSVFHSFSVCPHGAEMLPVPGGRRPSDKARNRPKSQGQA